MTSPPLADLISTVDPADALRVLFAELQSLADRLGIKDESRTLQQTLKATQERISGPRTVVMLMCEDAGRKRRFLERLLGQELAAVPQAASGCVRLEHGAEAECTVTLPQGLTAVLPLERLGDFMERRSGDLPARSLQTVRVPNAALAGGLAVIDTPAIAADEPSDTLLEAAAQTDAWIFVLGADHALSEAGLHTLRALPRPATRLDLVVEGAEGLTGEERLEARERLLRTLKERCGMVEPRLTLLASGAAEGKADGFWQGRFATFQSVTLLLGREHWLESTRTLVADALSETGAEIEFELKELGLGLRQARLRLALKELEQLQHRFHAEALRDDARPHAAAPVLVPPLAGGRQGEPAPQDEEPTEAGAGEPAERRTGSEGRVEGRVGDGPAHSEHAVAQTGLGPLPGPTFVRFEGPAAAEQGDNGRAGEPHSTGKLRGAGRRERAEWQAADSGMATLLGWLLPHRGPEEKPVGTLGRIAGIAVVAVVVCLLVLAMWPRGRARMREAAAQFNYQPADNPETDGTSAGARGGAAAPGAAAAAMPPPEQADAGPDTATGETPESAAAETAATAAGTATGARTALPRPSPNLELPRQRRRRHHGFLGIARLWHWVRHPGKPRDAESQ